MILKGGIYTTEFSEFTYGYALTRNIEHDLPSIIAVPSFPSLRDEGKAGGGYDVQIMTPIAPLFLQFKIPRIIRRRSSNAPEHMSVTPPYYRVYLHRRSSSDQQKLLLDLAAKYPAVFYASPQFDDANSIDIYHRAKQIILRSAFFRPDDIGPLPDDEEHYIAFNAGADVAHFCSDPREIPKITYRNIQDLLDRLKGTRNDRRQDFFARLIQDMLSIVATNRPYRYFGELEDPRKAYFKNKPEVYAAYLAQIYFDCQLFVLCDRSNELS